MILKREFLRYIAGRRRESTGLHALLQQAVDAGENTTVFSEELKKFDDNIAAATKEFEVLDRAVEIADKAMFELLDTLAVAHDAHHTTFGLTNDDQEEVASLEEASTHLREAVEWLLERSYVETVIDQSGEYVYVLRRPGE